MARKPIIDKTEPLEKRIEKLEMIVSRLSRRQVKKTQAMITPYPISACLIGEIDGPVLKYMFSARGTISRGQASFDVKPKVGVGVIVSIENDLGATTRAYNLTKKVTMIEPDMEVYSGDKLTVSAHILDFEKDKEITEAWISLLWIPHKSETDIRQFLIDELENENR